MNVLYFQMLMSFIDNQFGRSKSHLVTSCAECLDMQAGNCRHPLFKIVFNHAANIQNVKTCSIIMHEILLADGIS